ncbi:two-component system, NtrC family, nitrogen regulation response regulator GlnG [Persephonella hydrogeniphila]|uniref:DNA-binding transcriptional regulator NtrC n=1 Tax=Persephonella hydrogeniphila TaxID=198703 RepID=A0A285N1M0_9AQUI|nr:sigma-54 dependent transcriptional regulator [Persephonella hydrogeniphila]SNZ02813.1 two-component system, NtrC family, nitrogen regulation response regulator GlnG [Persephonella hydrogeniphila]
MKALVFDDERTIRKVLEKILKKEGLEVKTFESGINATDIIKKEKPEIVFLDISLQDANGMDILKSMLVMENRPYVIMISGHDEYNYLIEAMKLGAFDYIPKPFDIDKIRRVIKEIREILSAKTVSDSSEVDIVGKSPAMKEVFKIVGRASASNQPVLITGESGTGKEVIANLIHRYSNRSDKPFIAINCAAIPSGLIESELFGYERGAFTGADRSRPGKFQAADGGTIFLDEISELPLEAQGKLLRVLQEMEVTPVGSNKRVKVDVRVIAATNKDLIKLVAENKFREDLFYRLSVIEINLPPLRERKEDIPELVELFTKQALKIHGLKKGGFTEEAVKLLAEYDFPGNIRELKNLVNKLIAIYRDRPITPDLIQIQTGAENKNSFDWKEGIKKEVSEMFIQEKKNIYTKIIEEAEKVVIEEILKYTKGNISEASKYLGIHRNTVHKKIEELNIDKGRE